MPFLNWVRSRAGGDAPAAPAGAKKTAPRPADEPPGADPLHDMDFIDLTLVEAHNAVDDVTHLGLCPDGRPEHTFADYGSSAGPWI